MGTKISWAGLAIMLVSPVFGLGSIFVLVGAIVLVIGVVLQFLDK